MIRTAASLWDCHVGGGRGELPARKAADMSGARAAMVVYAQMTRYVPAKFKWDGYIADIPAPNSRISVGMPVCTVMATGSTAGPRAPCRGACRKAPEPPSAPVAAERLTT